MVKTMADRVELKPLPPKAAIEYFRKKVYKLTFNYTDMQREEHAYNFTVAKATTLDILQDIRQAVDAAIVDGTTLKEFQGRLKPILHEKGWWGKKEVIDPVSGELSEVQLGSPRRLRTIFDTNISAAYAAGKWEGIQRAKKYRPYLVYDAVNDSHTRPQHRAWDGTVLPADDPFWDEHYPANGWGCRCTVRQLGPRDLQRQGLEVSKAPPTGAPRTFIDKKTGATVLVPPGIDPGFAYNVGKARMKAMVPPAVDRPLEIPFAGDISAFPSPLSRPLPKDKILSPDLPEEEYVRRFMKEFGGDIGKPVVFKDVTGDHIVISDDLFKNAKGEFKVKKRGRHIYMLLLAEAIKNPDEVFWVWREYPKGRWTLSKAFLTNWKDDKDIPAFTMFDTGPAGWQGVTTFSPDRKSYLANQRDGALAYRRPDNK
ncbi:MAG: hypothetical protein DI551_08250 [Micavibrio aeruginosavorus]|uniref:Phage head morphogenesis protein n=1 Tax=Micavibrio aeruginosavorus TaxID=349221 RepID=A0A2W5MYE3_9BACT|nr:MAG: hypothetical protein DI551_08250 [Micavibrio aeruginosavorus]